MRYTLILCALVISILVIAGLILNWTLRNEVQSEVDENLEATYDQFLNDNVSSDDLLEWFFQLSEEDGFFNFAYQDRFGNVVGGIAPDIFEIDGFDTVISNDLFDGTFVSDFTVLFEHEDVIDDDKWRVLVGDLDGGRIVIFEPIENIEDALALVTTFLTYVGAALVVATLIAGGILASRQQQRIDKIETGLARIGQGDLSQTLAPQQLHDDLDQIMAGIDDAAVQLNSSMSQLRLFTQNAAHELNTPLARLRAQLDQLDESPEKNAALAEADTVIRTLAGVQRIARLSHRANVKSFADVDLGEIANLMRDLYADVAEENGQSLVVEMEDPATVQGDFQLIAQMASNLIENAMRHAGEKAKITIRADQSTLHFSDTGKGLTAAEAANVFAPFERDQSAGGSGLGLALVKAVADYHRANITNDSTNGFTIRVAFPTPD